MQKVLRIFIVVLLLAATLGFIFAQVGGVHSPLRSSALAKLRGKVQEQVAAIAAGAAPASKASSEAVPSAASQPVSAPTVLAAPTPVLGSEALPVTVKLVAVPEPQADPKSREALKGIERALASLAASARIQTFLQIFLAFIYFLILLVLLLVMESVKKFAAVAGSAAEAARKSAETAENAVKKAAAPATARFLPRMYRKR